VRSTTTNTNTNTNNLQQPYYSLNRYMLEVRSLRVYFSTISSDSFYSFVFVAWGKLGILCHPRYILLNKPTGPAREVENAMGAKNLHHRSPSVYTMYTSYQTFPIPLSRGKS